MHTLQAMLPSHELRKYVRVYAQRVTNLNVPIKEPIPARLETVLEFEFQDPFSVDHPDGKRYYSPDAVVIGPHTVARSVMTLEGRIESFGIFFQPAGFYRLFQARMRDLANRHFEACAALGRVILELRDRLAEKSSFADRVRLMESFLIDRAAEDSCGDPLMEIADHILAVHGAIRVVELADQAGLGVRQFERKFQELTGVTPKRFARVARFQTALDTKLARPRSSWLEIAHSLDYHDQMHMVRDFQELAGESPSRILSAIGDARPLGARNQQAVRGGVVCESEYPMERSSASPRASTRLS